MLLTPSCQISFDHYMIPIMSKPLIPALRALPHEVRQFEPGNLLFAQGDRVQVLYLIETGNVRLLRHLSDGFALSLHHAGPGAILAEASVFSETYHCDAVACGATSALCLEKPELRAAMARDSALMLAWAGYLAHEVQATRFRAEILAIRTVAQRLDVWLASNDGALPDKGRWHTLAAEIGVSAEALYRELAKRRVYSGSTFP